LCKDWSRAAAFWRRSTAVIVGRTQRGTLDAGQAVTGKKKSEAEQLDWHFWGLIKVVHRLALEGRGPDEAAAREMFLTAQWAINSEAAQSLAQMAARGASGDPGLAVLVRERQDLVAEWQKGDALRNAALGEAPGKRNAIAEAENVARLVATDGRIAEIGQKLAVEFPDYAALASPGPLSVEEVQAQLGADEALVLFLNTSERKPTPDETFIWVVTKTDIRWVRSDLGTAGLAREVQALRCGLDAAAWMGSRCAELTGQSRAGATPSFDHGRAHKLYKALFGQVEDLIQGKHLLLVPSGPLTQLPFQVLVTAPPKNDDHRSIAWLARGHALTILPAVSSLKALRRVARPSAATKPMIGFGNPLLDGPDSRYHKLARLARDKQKCPETILRQLAGLLELRGGVPALETQDGLANVSYIRVQAPLPETADELCAVARDINADAGEMRLGARATEHEVKALSASGQLAQYRIVHFATHGAMAGELRGSSQPGLLLTPPQEASDDDDGYLSASEIAGLKLDADWVILSACNTAAGNAAKAEALSGLARAFIYAQARALLVSHWAVDSGAAVKLVTTAIGEMSRDRDIGRSEALRRAMLALIDKGAPHEAHPAYWAPFVVVGEGTR
jgi:CHAT domain-containing protein